LQVVNWGKNNPVDDLFLFSVVLPSAAVSGRLVKEVIMVPEVLDRERSLTIGEFCLSERISRSTFYDLDKRGLGPEIDSVPGTRIRRITPSARRAWRERMRELRASEAAQLEQERKRAQAQEAGRIAAQSPLHVSNRHKAVEQIKRRRGPAQGK
jgi:hypothetical protein